MNLVMAIELTATNCPKSGKPHPPSCDVLAFDSIPALWALCCVCQAQDRPHRPLCDVWAFDPGVGALRCPSTKAEGDWDGYWEWTNCLYKDQIFCPSLRFEKLNVTWHWPSRGCIYSTLPTLLTASYPKVVLYVGQAHIEPCLTHLDPGLGRMCLL